MTKCKLSPMALGLSLGIVWGGAVFIMGLVAYFATYGKPFVDAMAVLYVGYAPSILGSLIGGLIGFIDAFIGGAIIAMLYNLIAEPCSCCAPKIIQQSEGLQ